MKLKINIVSASYLTIINAENDKFMFVMRWGKRGYTVVPIESKNAALLKDEEIQEYLKKVKRLMKGYRNLSQSLTQLKLAIESALTIETKKGSK